MRILFVLIQTRNLLAYTVACSSKCSGFGCRGKIFLSKAFGLVLQHAGAGEAKGEDGINHVRNLRQGFGRSKGWAAANVGQFTLAQHQKGAKEHFEEPEVLVHRQGHARRCTVLRVPQDGLARPAQQAEGHVAVLRASEKGRSG